MKNLVVTAMLLLLASGIRAQQLRYFEFRTECGYNEWRDTTFIVATADTAVIADVLNDLQKPRIERKLIIGFIASGNGGFNRNASHWFGWHFVPGQWHLQELAMEVCDGCPYSDIDLNPNYWLNQIGEFCPWTSSVAREVTHLMESEEPIPELDFSFFPNPAHDKLTVTLPSTENLEITLTNAVGQTIRKETGTNETDVSGLPAGLYFLRVEQNGKAGIRKVMIN